MEHEPAERRPVRYPDPAVQILDPSFAKYRIFHSALELNEEARFIYVAEACAGDASLCERVEALLRASAAAERVRAALRVVELAESLALVAALLLCAARATGAQLPPNEDWHTIRTRHFRVHFTPPVEEEARARAMAALEKARV